MILERICSIEVARLAKEKGFANGSRRSYCEYHTDYFYDGDPDHHESYGKGEVRLDGDFFMKNNDKACADYSNENYTLFEAPTHQILQDWLREVKEVHIEFMFDDNTWYGRIGKFCVPDFVHDHEIALEESDGYRDALEAYGKIFDKTLLKALETL